MQKLRKNKIMDRVNHNLIEKRFLKILALVLLSTLGWAGLLTIGGTFSFYNDTENSNGNYFQAEGLDFDLDSPSDFTPSPILPGESANRSADFINHLNNPKYKVYATGFVGDPCQYLGVQVNLNGENAFTGRLTDLETGIVLFDGDPNNWQFTATLDNNAPENVQGKTCSFKIVFSGSQQKNNLPFGQGFTDEEELDSHITVGVWQEIVINKVYYDVDLEHGDEGKNEWVELYNPTESAVNLKNWELCDNNDCEVINPNIEIPAKGFALISHDASTWQLYWDVPDYIVKINQLGGKFIYLNNEADMLLLKNPDGIIIDQMNWGDPDPSWDNYNSNLWDPGVPDVDEGHMLGRVPTGHDTDQPSDWKDISLPSVEVSIPNGGEIWYMVPDSWPENDQERAFCQAHGMNENCEYEIRWTATNPNGDDNDLLVNIYYSVNSGHSWILQVANNIENSGSFWWKIPYNHAYVTEKGRIKVEAIWTENGMVQSWDISDSDFCPPMLTIEDLLDWENSQNQDNRGSEPSVQQDQNQNQDQGQNQNQNQNQDQSQDEGNGNIDDGNNGEENIQGDGSEETSDVESTDVDNGENGNNGSEVEDGDKTEPEDQGSVENNDSDQDSSDGSQGDDQNGNENNNQDNNQNNDEEN